MSKARVALIYGGRSGEHEVSVASARSLVRAIDPDRYTVLPIKIDHEGSWLLSEPGSPAATSTQRVLPSADPGRRGFVCLATSGNPDGDFYEIDVAFPLVHGTYGEDGCLQGLLEMAGIPYVGSGVLASAVSMDKIVMKSVFRAEGFPTPRWIAVDRTDAETDPCLPERIAEEIGFPCFVKPSNLGSSVGINKARDEDQLADAIALAAQFSARLIVEQGLEVREIECGVLGNHEPSASVVGEIIPARDFYDYEAKYHDQRTQFVIPASLPEAIASRVRDLAVRAFQAIGGAGMARVDFFLGRDDGAVYLNEINTIPGFTDMSVYPRLWNASGVAYGQLIDRLISLAFERHADQARNRTRYA
ncbi:MAG TPA: D-alanine--D-alanine ligase family protein [Chloroflexota bacterium]|nr:D-alanine--D-alanine ligase family protein [Chloroflexota bacterium]